MKKIVGIIAALALASAVFADAPSATPAVAEFSGNATFGWKADLDADTHGMYNNDTATLKITWVTAGDVTKEHSKDLWGEIQVKNDAWEGSNALPAAKAASVATAKIHFIDNDDGFFLNMNILNGASASA